MATLLTVDGKESQVAPADADNGFSLAEVYRLIGCQTVEIVTLPDGRILAFDEEGKYAEPAKQWNSKATELARKAGIAPWDMVLGDALVCTPVEFP